MDSYEDKVVSEKTETNMLCAKKVKNIKMYKGS